VVLGAGQDRAVVRVGEADAQGFGVVRRRSGGGVVHLVPGSTVWADLWIPRGDPLWDDDVIEAPMWVGACWAAALGDLGVRDTGVHTGRSRSPDGETAVLCFACTGSGEVTVGGRKLVGVAQWRCREGALFSTALYRTWEASVVAPLVAPPSRVQDVTRSLASVCIGLADLLGPPGPEPDTVADALEAHLPQGPPWQVALR
jgi:lipoate-protein ligase A